MYNDAQNLLKNIMNGKKLLAHGVVAFYPANSVGDDIEVYGENGQVLAVLHGLRQQVVMFLLHTSVSLILKVHILILVLHLMGM